MINGRILGIDLGATSSLVALVRWESPIVITRGDGSAMDERIKLWAVEKKLDPYWEGRARRIEQKCERNLRKLNRQINACHDDNARAADLWERYYACKARLKEIKGVLET